MSNLLTRAEQRAYYKKMKKRELIDLLILRQEQLDSFQFARGGDPQDIMARLPRKKPKS